jgi:RHS repeat-associated protein
MATYKFNINLPKGVNNHTPDLSMSYNSGNGYGICGMGWQIGPGSIKRQTEKGIPRYVDSPNNIDDDHDGQIDEYDEIDTFLGLDNEELISINSNTFRARIENNFIRYKKIDNYWQANLKDGSYLIFGKSPTNRMTDHTGHRIFEWLLEKRVDVNGNTIQYKYTDFGDDQSQQYLKQIQYGPGNSPWTVFYFVYFTYEIRPDIRKNYKSGFMIKTTRRLKQIDIGIEGLPEQDIQKSSLKSGDWNQNNSPDALIRRYVFEYEEKSPHMSLLSSITQFGADAANYLPPVHFSYGLCLPDQIISAKNAIIGSVNEPVSVMDNPFVEIIDLNSDGLPDILNTSTDGVHAVHLNSGVKEYSDGQKILWMAPREITGKDAFSVHRKLNDERLHLADMNGDGISDLVYTDPFDCVSYYLNTGKLSWDYQQKMSIQSIPPPAPFSHSFVKSSDCNFDKRIDIIKSTENGYTIWFNISKGLYSPPVMTSGAVYQNHTILFSDTGVHMADMNGDRMNDVVKIRATQVIYCPNMGNGFFDDAVIMPILDQPLTDAQIKKARLEDINGDGFSDLIIERASINTLWYWLNYGLDSFDHKHIIENMPQIFSSTMVTRWADMNGNGTTDLIYADSSYSPRLRIIDIGELIGRSNHTNLLTQIDNGRGIQTNISYQSSTNFYILAMETNPWETVIPFPVSVISRIETKTGMDQDDIPGNDIYAKDYLYRNAFYDDNEKAFRGFAQVKVIEYGDRTFPTLHTDYSFHTGGPDGTDNDHDQTIDEISQALFREDDALKGVVLKTELTTEAGKLFSKEISTWQVKTLLTGMNNIEIRFAQHLSSREMIYEGTSIPESILITRLYDDYGNIREEKNYGALSINGDEIFTYKTVINDTNNWILGKAAVVYKTDADNQKAEETRYYYDGEPYTGLSLGMLEKGNTSRVEGWVQSNRYINLKRHKFDAYGNITGIKDPNNNERSIVYDPIFHTFPEQEIIHFTDRSNDLHISVNYHPGFGNIVSSTDVNGNVTDYHYDTFGRIVRIIKPGDSIQYPTQQFVYKLANPHELTLYAYDDTGKLTIIPNIQTASSITTRQIEKSGVAGTLDHILYMDGMDRKLVELLEWNTGFIAKNAVRFNKRGTVKYEFLPWHVMTSDYHVPEAAMVAKKELHYDAKGRNITTFDPPNKNGNIYHSSQEYFPLKTIVTDQNTHKKEYMNSGCQQLIKVREYNDDQTYLTQYEYTVNGDLTKIIDAHNNIKIIDYDGIKRKTLIDDPDKGRITYQYDRVGDYESIGNLIMTTDNKGQHIYYTYDEVNRVLTESQVQESTPDVSYHYDHPSLDFPGFTNAKGMLSYVKDQSGAIFFSYDTHGNVDKRLKRIVHSGQNNDFLFIYKYDAMDRVFEMIFPDSDSVIYHYDDSGHLNDIPGIIHQMQYYPSEQIKSIDYANQVSTQYIYDPGMRLTDLTTQSKTQSQLQNLSYIMDGVGNITDIIDNRPIPLDAGNATQTFKYDDLNRLAHVSGLGYGTIDYHYDAIGNMIYKSSPDTAPIEDPLINLKQMIHGGSLDGSKNRISKNTGDPPGPHAVTSTESGLTYDYDDNGNMTANSNGDRYTWNYKDQLIQVHTKDKNANYVYDYNGQRVIKQVNDGSSTTLTYYVSNDYEIRNSQAVKYIFAGKRRIARIEGNISETIDQTAYQTLLLKPGWNFFALTVEPLNSDVQAIVSTLGESFSEIWSFDAENQVYKGYAPKENIQTLTELHAQKGYLILINQPVTLVISGNKVFEDIHLSSQWNLIGSWSSSSIPIDNSFQNIQPFLESVWSYDNTNNKWKHMFFADNIPQYLNTLTWIHPYSTYWVHVNAPCQLKYNNNQSEKIYFYHPDHLGSSSLLTDESGSVVERTEFYPFGRVRYEERSGGNSFYKFTGKELDGESGLQYFGARYYDAVIGRFIQVDPLIEDMPEKWLSNPQRLNLQSYCSNNPINLIDPEGMDQEDTFITEYNIQRGDSLSSIAEKMNQYYKTDIYSAKNIAAFNNIKNPDKIFIGESLNVDPTEFVWKKHFEVTNYVPKGFMAAMAYDRGILAGIDAMTGAPSIGKSLIDLIPEAIKAISEATGNKILQAKHSYSNWMTNYVQTVNFEILQMNYEKEKPVDSKQQIQMFKSTIKEYWESTGFLPPVN